MDRSIVVMASLAGTAFTVLTWTGYRVHAADRAALRDLERRLEMRSEAPSEPIRASDDDTRPLAELEEAVQELALRMRRLEHVSQRTPIPGRTQPPESRLEPEPAEPLARGGEPDAALRQEFDECLAQLIESGWDFSGSREGFERFLALAREKPVCSTSRSPIWRHTWRRIRTTSRAGRHSPIPMSGS